MRRATWRAACGRRSMGIERVRSLLRIAVGVVPRLTVLTATAIVAAGCVAGTHTLDAALPVALRVTTTPETVEVDAPGWFAEVSQVFICPVAPPALPDDVAERRGWSPGGDCHDYGRYSSQEGLALSLPVAELDGPAWSTFQAAENWYLMLLDIDGDLAASAIRTRFHAPALPS